jgi:sugar lactone lactonase YvrE
VAFRQICPARPKLASLRKKHLAKNVRTSFFGVPGGTPNGICIDERGNCIIANIGNGEVQSLSGDRSRLVLMTEAQGKRMYTPNFPFITVFIFNAYGKRQQVAYVL